MLCVCMWLSGCVSMYECEHVYVIMYIWILEDNFRFGSHLLWDTISVIFLLCACVYIVVYVIIVYPRESFQWGRTIFVTVFSILSCQINYIWNELQFWMEGTLVIQILRQEDNMPLFQSLRQEGTLLIWATPSAGSLYKDHGRRMASFFTYLPLSCEDIHWSLLLLDSSTFRRSTETSSLIRSRYQYRYRYR